MRRIAALIFAVLALALVAAGCGGGGDSTGSSTADSGSSSSESSTESSDESESSSDSAAPTKAVFIKEADKICSTADAKLSQEVVSYAKANGISVENEPSKDDQSKIYEDVVLPNVHMQAEELEGLTPPAGDEETVEDITSTLTDEIESAENDPGNIDENTLQEASKKAKAYGLQTCGG
jgi:hypothetical protein